MGSTCNAKTLEAEAGGLGVQHHPQLRSWFKASLGYMKHCLNKLKFKFKKDMKHCLKKKNKRGNKEKRKLKSIGYHLYHHCQVTTLLHLCLCNKMEGPILWPPEINTVQGGCFFFSWRFPSPSYHPPRPHPHTQSFACPSESCLFLFNNILSPRTHPKSRVSEVQVNFLDLTLQPWSQTLIFGGPSVQAVGKWERRGGNLAIIQ